MNKSEFSSLALRDLQQRQGNSFSPRGQISRSRAGFIQAAYDITCTLIDRLPPAVLLDLPVLILPQEQRQRFRHSKHGKLGGQCAGQVVSQLQCIFLSASKGIAIALALRKNFPKTPQIAGNVLQRFTIAHTL